MTGQLKAVVLAAGKGVRLRPVTEGIPKVMVKVAGRPLLERILENLLKAGVKETHLVVGYRKEVVEEHFGSDFNGMKLNYFVKGRQLGTAHAVSLVEGYTEERFLMLNGDVLVDAELLKKLALMDEFDPFDVMIVARRVQDPWRYGVLKVQGNKVVDIVEKPAPGKEPSNLINAGIYRFTDKIFESIKKTKLSERNEFEIVDSIKIAMKSGANVGFLLHEGLCIDVGDEDDLRKANEMKL